MSSLQGFSLIRVPHTCPCCAAQSSIPQNDQIQSRTRGILILPILPDSDDSSSTNSRDSSPLRERNLQVLERRHRALDSLINQRRFQNRQLDNIPDSLLEYMIYRGKDLGDIPVECH